MTSSPDANTLILTQTTAAVMKKTTFKLLADGKRQVGKTEATGPHGSMPITHSRRPHQALGYATPMVVWCDGVVGAVAAQAVDMMDNARASPTCPLPQQQQTAALAA
jgi:hypothetical protein